MKPGLNGKIKIRVFWYGLRPEVEERRAFQGIEDEFGCEVTHEDLPEFKDDLPVPNDGEVYLAFQKDVYFRIRGSRRFTHSHLALRNGRRVVPDERRLNVVVKQGDKQMVNMYVAGLRRLLTGVRNPYGPLPRLKTPKTEGQISSLIFSRRVRGYHFATC